MAQWMIVNESNDWNILERTKKKSKGLLMVKNDKKWQSVIMRENDKKWQIMTQKGPKISFKTDEILRYELFNL